MSLEEPFGMLGIDHKNAGRGTTEPGRNPGVFGGQRWVRIRGPRSRGGLRVGEPDAASDTLPGFEAERTWTGASIRVQDDGASTPFRQLTGAWVHGSVSGVSVNLISTHLRMPRRPGHRCVRVL